MHEEFGEFYERLNSDPEFSRMYLQRRATKIKKEFREDEKVHDLEFKIRENQINDIETCFIRIHDIIIPPKGHYQDWETVETNLYTAPELIKNTRFFEALTGWKVYRRGDCRQWINAKTNDPNIPIIRSFLGSHSDILGFESGDTCDYAPKKMKFAHGYFTIEHITKTLTKFEYIKDPGSFHKYNWLGQRLNTKRINKILEGVHPLNVDLDGNPSDFLTPAWNYSGAIFLPEREGRYRVGLVSLNWIRHTGEFWCYAQRR